MLAITSGMEYAFKQAPETMKSLVMAVFLFMAALASVLAQAFVPFAEDPLLEWNYAVPAVLVALAAVGFWWTSRGMEDTGDDSGLMAVENADVDARLKGKRLEKVAEKGP